MAHFDDRMMHMPWEDFITEFLVRSTAQSISWRGTTSTSATKGRGNPTGSGSAPGCGWLGCDIIPKVELDGITISSTYIRTLLAQGGIGAAKPLPGPPHTLTDTVHHGKKLGSTLGFPTVNLAFQPGVLIPAQGVYAARVWFENGRPMRGHQRRCAPHGGQPAGEVNVEGFILDFDAATSTARSSAWSSTGICRGEQKFPPWRPCRRGSCATPGGDQGVLPGREM